MQVICKAQENLQRVLGDGMLMKQPFRPARFLVTETIPQGLLIYNPLTLEMALFTPEEAAFMESHFAFRKAVENGRFTTPGTVPLPEVSEEEPEKKELLSFLVRHYYLVPEDFAEIKTVDEVRDILLLSKKKKKGYDAFTILTTTDCNARCFYCYEQGCEKMTMDEEKANRAAAWILANREPDCPLSFVWFGGEPLYNATAIDIITDRLNREGVTFTSDMVTNGYLFDEAMVKRAAKWNLKSAQITLDGTEPVYNFRKAYIYHDGSAFQTVLANIERLLQSDIRVNLRFNLDLRNAADLSRLIDCLSARFTGEKKPYIYVKELYDLKGQEGIYQTLEGLRQKLIDNGFHTIKGLPKSLSLYRCQADNPNSVVILPDLSLHSCEHFNESLPAWGSLDSSVVKEELRKPWSEYKDRQTLCDFCPMASTCRTVKPCPPGKHPCSDEEVQYHHRRFRQIMRAEWEKFERN